ncbi:hypothetical protein ABMA57_07500 [Saccharospirillum sp. HFRX-1]|uniref:hypothetical protein n=1 Tax=unclassified Saccharospirillum TaxID=2633430 RepID=UPI003720744B
MNQNELLDFINQRIELTLSGCPAVHQRSSGEVLLPADVAAVFDELCFIKAVLEDAGSRSLFLRMDPPEGFKAMHLGDGYSQFLKIKESDGVEQ